MKANIFVFISLHFNISKKKKVELTDLQDLKDNVDVVILDKTDKYKVSA